MKLDKLFGSKAKVDIIKYLLFRREGVSMRALETELEWTFPAIKKQVDALEEAEVITVNKDNTKRSIHLHTDIKRHLHSVFIFGLLRELYQRFQEVPFVITKFYLGKAFGHDLDMDLVIIYDHASKQEIEDLKQQISVLFASYHMDNIALTTMSQDEWDKRNRLADRFVLAILRSG